MRLRRLPLAPLLLVVAGSLGAQAPRITSKGDPSVNPDTIYRLAVDPARFADQEAAFLLDDGVVRLDADGRGTRTFRQIVQILKPGAVDRFQEQTFSYSPSHEKFTLNWVRVVRKDGSVVSDKPAHVQDADQPADTDDPVYTDRRIKRVSLSGVAPGTLVDYSYTTEELKPFLPRDFTQSWSVSTGLPVARSRLVVDLPDAVVPRIRETNLDFKRVEHSANGRHTYIWATANVPKIKPEALASDSNGVFMSLALTAPIGWDDIALWYAGLERPRAVASPFVVARVDSLVRGSRTRNDTIRAVHRWVAQDVRYVAIALGLGGYQPRAPDQVLRTGFGDCKDKATLFVAALGHLGITAYPVLLNSRGGVRRELPSISQLNHEIAALPEGAGYHFVDLTAESTPFDELPAGEQGAFGLVVRPDGTSEVATLPRAPITANASAQHVVAVLDTAGYVNATYEETASGSAQYGLRNLFRHPLDSAQRANLANAVAGRIFEGAEGDSLVGFDGQDLRAPARLRLRISHGRAAQRSGSTLILAMPMGSMSAMDAAAREIEREPRRFPIDPAKFWGRKTTEMEYRFTLPAGWHAQLPKSVTANSAFGSYQSAYTAEGGVLRLVRRISGAAEVQPPDSVGALATWLRAVAKDDASIIVLTRDAQ
jgi:hypothetical protein